MSTTAEAPSRQREVLEAAVIRFAGDSGDGMQITGNQFTNTAALFGNDLATFPDYPAEIRAPAGTLPGVSGFQVHFGARDINTPGDALDALIAMNPAALKVNLSELKTNGILVVNVDNFKDIDLRKAQLESNPLEDRSLDGYRVFPVELTKLTRAALADVGLDSKSMDRCKNFLKFLFNSLFITGLIAWLRPHPDNRYWKQSARPECFHILNGWCNTKYTHPDLPDGQCPVKQSVMKR
jgi:2-oxoglutarate ferredoxin oxidoreductase subunit alpha